MIAREPTSRSPSHAQPGDRRAAVAAAGRRAAATSGSRSTRAESGSASAPARLRPPRTGARPGTHVELRGVRGHRFAEHNGRRCCWSSTSATRRPTSAPSAARSCSSTGALPPCASRPPTSSARRCATCSSCAATRFDRPRRLDRLLDRPPARARVDGDGAPLSRPRDARRRPRHEDRHGDPLRQPARDRRRPARQRGRHPRALRRPGACASTSAPRPPSTSSRATASTSAARS